MKKSPITNTPTGGAVVPEDEMVMHGLSESGARNVRPDSRGKATGAVLEAAQKEAFDRRVASPTGDRNVGSIIAAGFGPTKAARERMGLKRASTPTTSTPTTFLESGEDVAPAAVVTATDAPSVDLAADLGVTPAATPTPPPAMVSPPSPAQSSSRVGDVMASITDAAQTAVGSVRSVFTAVRDRLRPAAPIAAGPATVAATASTAPATAQAIADSIVDMNPEIPADMVHSNSDDAMKAYQAISAIARNPSLSKDDKLKQITDAQSPVQDSALEAFAAMCKSILGLDGPDDAKRTQALDALDSSFAFLGPESPSDPTSKAVARDESQTMEMSTIALGKFHSSGVDAQFMAPATQAFGAGDFGKVAAHVKAGKKPPEAAATTTATASLDPLAPADSIKISPTADPKKEDFDTKRAAIITGKAAVALTLAFAIPGAGPLAAVAFLAVTHKFGQKKPDEKVPEIEIPTEAVEFGDAFSKFLAKGPQQQAAALTSTTPDPTLPQHSPAHYTGTPTQVGASAGKAATAAAATLHAASQTLGVTRGELGRLPHEITPAADAVVTAVPTTEPLSPAPIPHSTSAEPDLAPAQTTTDGPSVVEQSVGMVVGGNYVDSKTGEIPLPLPAPAPGPVHEQEPVVRPLDSAIGVGSDAGLDETTRLLFGDGTPTPQRVQETAAASGGATADEVVSPEEAARQAAKEAAAVVQGHGGVMEEAGGEHHDAGHLPAAPGHGKVDEGRK